MPGPLVRREGLQGGSLSAVTRLHFADGTTAVAKTGPRLAAEARMLGALGAPGAPVPAVHSVDDGLLVMADLGEGGPLDQAAWSDLGAALARLHRSSGAAYGWSEDHAFGRVSIANAPTADWPTFWAERRLLPGIEELPPDLARRVEALAATLPQRLPSLPKRALLHGDLWVGNVVASGGRIAGLIDPACYYGHGEVDLAMLALFADIPRAFWAAYPAEAEHEERRPIYTIWPALVHFRLFGSGYRGLVEATLDRARAPG